MRAYWFMYVKRKALIITGSCSSIARCCYFQRQVKPPKLSLEWEY